MSWNIHKQNGRSPVKFGSPKFDSRPKQESKIVVYGVPDYTSAGEIQELIDSWLLNIKVEEVKILIPNKSKKDNLMKTLIAFVTLDSNRSADEVIQYYQENTMRPVGFIFTNQKGITSQLFLSYCYQRNKEPKNRKHDVDAEKHKAIICELEVEKESLLSFIKTLEEKVKERLPDLFVSELEMHELREEEKYIIQQNQEKIQQLEFEKLELAEVKELYNQLEMSDEDIT